MKKILILLTLLAACGGSGNSGIFTSPSLIAVDSTNDRLFVLENNGVLSILTASTREAVASQPFVSAKLEPDVHALLPVAPLQFKVVPEGTTSRLFITGSETNAGGNTVFNQILVLNFDGTTLAAASFSPIVLSDGDDATDETENIPGGLEADIAGSRLFVTDSTAGRLYTLSTTDGSEAAVSLAIAGTPNRMSLTGNHLFIANSTGTEESQLITVVNTDDFTTTTLDLDAATDGISAATNGTGTVLLAKRADGEGVLIRTVDTTTFDTATAVPVSDSSAQDGLLTSTHGISSVAGDVVLAQTSSETIYGYVPQADGNITLITFATDLSSFLATTLSTATRFLTGSDLYTNASGEGITLYMAARGTGDLVFTDVGSTEVGARF